VRGAKIKSAFLTRVSLPHVGYNANGKLERVGCTALLTRVSLPHVGYNTNGKLERAGCTCNANFPAPGLGITCFSDQREVTLPNLFYMPYYVFLLGDFL
jgi:hypothetical protein